MKKLLAMILISCALWALLGVCTAETAAWEADIDGHWHSTAAGEKIDFAPHTLDEYDVCTVCAAELTFFGDETWVAMYNEQGDGILSMTYDADGSLLEDRRIEYTYDADGNWQTQKIYSFGELSSESTFGVVYSENDVYTYADQTTYYNEDGTKLIERYNEYFDLIQETLYGPDGALVYDYTVEYEYDGDDVLHSVRKYDGEELVEEILSEYDDDGNLVAERTYAHGKPVREDFYTFADDENFSYSYISKQIFHNEDGTQTTVEYDENGEEIG